jgi:hypothetical protein
LIDSKKTFRKLENERKYSKKLCRVYQYLLHEIIMGMLIEWVEQYFNKKHMLSDNFMGIICINKIELLLKCSLNSTNNKTESMKTISFALESIPCKTKHTK